MLFTEKMVSDKLRKLNKAKSFGPSDKVHPRILYETPDEMAKPLTILYNKSLETGLVPKQWTEAHITAIHENGLKNIAGNYRPISLTSVGCKVFESIIRDHILNYLLRHDILSNKQYGFTAKRSTTLQL